MSTRADDHDRVLIAYLLDRMPAAQRFEFEARLLDDPALDEELLATVDDLIQEYLARRLSSDDKQRFEQTILVAPEFSERIKLMRALHAAVERLPLKDASPARAASRSAPASWHPWLGVAATFAAIAMLVIYARRTPPPPILLAAASPVPTPSPSDETDARPLNDAAPSPRPDTLRVVRLPPQPKAPVRIELSATTRDLRVEVVVDGESPSFDAAIRTADGKEVWRAEGLAPVALGQPLRLSVPAAVLMAANYDLRIESESLRGAPSRVLQYRLKIVRKQ
jgi:hypothetical protein